MERTPRTVCFWCHSFHFVSFRSILFHNSMIPCFFPYHFVTSLKDVKGTAYWWRVQNINSELKVWISVDPDWPWLTLSSHPQSAGPGCRARIWCLEAQTHGWHCATKALLWWRDHVGLSFRYVKVYPRLSSIHLFQPSEFISASYFSSVPHVFSSYLNSYPSVSCRRRGIFLWFIDFLLLDIWPQF